MAAALQHGVCHIASIALPRRIRRTCVRRDAPPEIQDRVRMDAPLFLRERLHDARGERMAGVAGCVRHGQRGSGVVANSHPDGHARLKHVVVHSFPFGSPDWAYRRWPQ